jgi:hypothetical protein
MEINCQEQKSRIDPTHTYVNAAYFLLFNGLLISCVQHTSLIETMALQKHFSRRSNYRGGFGVRSSASPRLVSCVWNFYI